MVFSLLSFIANDSHVIIDVCTFTDTSLYEETLLSRLEYIIYVAPVSPFDIAYFAESSILARSMKLVILAAATTLFNTASAHSWLHCTNHNNTGIRAEMAAAAIENPLAPVDPL